MPRCLWSLGLALLLGTGGVAGTECGPADPIAGGSVSQPPRPGVGSVLRYTCPPGTRPYPVAWRVCTIRGAWSPLRNAHGERSRSARCRPYQCAGPTHLQNGRFHPRFLLYRVNQTVQFECDQGFALLGSRNRTCRPNGRWSGTTTVCHAAGTFCPDPGIPLGGSRRGRGFEEGDAVSYLCSSGLVLRGPRTRTCLPSGKWSGRESTCESWYAFDYPEDVASELTLSEEILGHAKQGTHIYFLVDASASVGEDNLYKTLEFVAAFTEQTYSLARKVRFRVLVFASRVLYELGQESEAIFVDDFWSFNYTEHLSELGTNIGGALDRALSHINETVSASTPTTLPRQILLLITDGRHNVGQSPLRAAKAIKETVPDGKRNLDIFAIGIGDASKEALEELVTTQSAQRAFYFADYGQLEELTRLTGRPEGAVPVACGVRGRTRARRAVGRIYGGEDAEEKQWPWQALIHMSDKGYHGGGSVISRRWVITAAHNLYLGRPLAASEIRVFVGLLKRRSRNSKEVSEIHVHPLYNDTRATLTEDYAYDIGLLRLKEDLQFSQRVRPVCLPCSRELSEFLPAPEGSWRDRCAYYDRVLTGSSGADWREISGYVSGWGVKEDGKISYALKYGRISIKPRDQCLRNDLDLSQMCAKGDSVDACAGDSGGPFTITVNQRWIQIGIVSSGYTAECSANNMGYYTNIVHVMDWVKTVATDIGYE